MARTPKAALPPIPARRGRKPKDVAPEPAAAPNKAEAVAAPSAAPARGKPGPKPKPRPEAAAPAPAPAQDAGQPEATVEQALGVVAEMARPAGADAGDVAPALSQGAANPAKPAARWDRASDTVQFNWPEIERTAAHDGPNQVMAKLLVAARAEGAHSRWPL